MVRRCWVIFQSRGVLLIWIIVGQGPVALAVGAGGGCLDIFSLICPFSPLSPSLSRYRLKYCLKGPLNPEYQCLNILTYFMNVRMDGMEKVYCPFYLVVNYAPTHTSPMHGETSYVQVKDPVCSLVTLLHGGSSCRFDSLYFNLRKCNIFVTKVTYTPD